MFISTLLVTKLVLLLLENVELKFCFPPSNSRRKLSLRLRDTETDS